MSKFIKKISKKSGLPPGTLIHIGEKKTEKIKIALIDYNETYFQERVVHTIEECFQFKDKNRNTVTWINIDGIHQIDPLKKLGEHFELHPLILEDILNTDQRPKIEDLGEYIYIVLKTLYYNSKTEEVIIEQISLILGSNFVISFKEKEGDIFIPVIERIRMNKGRRIRKSGADYLAYCLLDAIVDNYFIILEILGEKIESLEERLINHPAPEILHIIYNLRRTMILLRRSVWPLRGVISELEREDSALITESVNLYIKDIYDHTLHVADTLETFREVLSEMVEIYLSGTSNKLNAVMKILTMIATVFMPLTFIAGIYGMNFEFMPELRWKWGYPTVLLLMTAVSISMIIYFKKKKWL
ncbi:MAG: magnesium/cobalt transporter CorA [Candidatus Loosdrechtia sp.]|uniref:magnesium and cobalt transport protein CorA n=1 Tax=Candidatus Loosdrechtia sp. TaxID=3101272 RepID=UPI003A676351|nr:MAG: magnesium/cobalt transporter CorA [Candidatus Jettenia sp. AMX2]